VNLYDLIWLAGLLEGEGTFDLQRGKYPRIRLAMTDRDVVGRAATLMGTKVRLSLRKAPVTSTWHAEVQGPRAEALMEALLPYMGSRRSGRIAGILADSRLRANGKAVVPGPKVTRPPGLPLAA
jgi:hypothetical protein